MTAPSVAIATIDLADVATCIAFRRDMYLTAFGTDEGLEDTMGADDSRYVAQLAAQLDTFPEGNVHARLGSDIVGQLEMRLLDDDPGVGYISLIYTLPTYRGSGVGRVLEAHAAAASKARGLERMRLSVAVTNEGAIAFYRRLGWHAVGTRPNVRPMTIMERELD